MLAHNPEITGKVPWGDYNVPDLLPCPPSFFLWQRSGMELVRRRTLAEGLLG
jgi:hypothetical protein